MLQRRAPGGIAIRDRSRIKWLFRRVPIASIRNASVWSIRHADDGTTGIAGVRPKLAQTDGYQARDCRTRTHSTRSTSPSSTKTASTPEPERTPRRQGPAQAQGAAQSASVAASVGRRSTFQTSAQGSRLLVPIGAMRGHRAQSCHAPASPAGSNRRSARACLTTAAPHSSASAAGATAPAEFHTRVFSTSQPGQSGHEKCREPYGNP